MYKRAFAPAVGLRIKTVLPESGFHGSVHER